MSSSSDSSDPFNDSSSTIDGSENHALDISSSSEKSDINSMSYDDMPNNSTTNISGIEGEIAELKKRVLALEGTMDQFLPQQSEGGRRRRSHRRKKTIKKRKTKRRKY
jgi:hypothetical protein